MWPGEVPRTTLNHTGLVSTGCCVSRAAGADGPAAKPCDSSLLGLSWKATICVPFPLAMWLCWAPLVSRQPREQGRHLTSLAHWAWLKIPLNAFRVREKMKGISGPSPKLRSVLCLQRWVCWWRCILRGPPGPCAQRGLGQPKLPGSWHIPQSNTLVLQPRKRSCYFNWARGKAAIREPREFSCVKLSLHIYRKINRILSLLKKMCKLYHGFKIFTAVHCRRDTVMNMVYILVPPETWMWTNQREINILVTPVK